MNSDLDVLLTLTLTQGLGPTLLRRCIKKFGSPQAILSARRDDLKMIDGIGQQKASSIRRSMDDLADGLDVQREKDLIQQHDVSLIAITDDNYPKLLRHIQDPPTILYVRGQIVEQDALGLAVVGARRCTAYGREQADRLASMCATAGLCIVSGGAYGIDAAAHRAALRVGGRTIAVLGSGLANPYPKDHIKLFDEIANENAGAVISELPMTSPPAAENFPSRNRIISGLSLGTLVIEAANRSGALITARLAAEDHAREVMALPGRVDSPMSAGCHRIIREGWATLVSTGSDILDCLGEAGEILKAGIDDQPNNFHNSDDKNHDNSNLFDQQLTDQQRKVAEAISTGQKSLDEIVRLTELGAGAVQAELTILQIRGLVARDAGGYIRKRNN